jgi:hypothetical protein
LTSSTYFHELSIATEASPKEEVVPRENPTGSPSSLHLKRKLSTQKSEEGHARSVSSPRFFPLLLKMAIDLCPLLSLSPFSSLGAELCRLLEDESPKPEDAPLEREPTPHDLTPKASSDGKQEQVKESEREEAEKEKEKEKELIENPPKRPRLTRGMDDCGYFEACWDEPFGEDEDEICGELNFLVGMIGVTKQRPENFMSYLS